MFISDKCIVYFCKCKFFGLRVLLQRIFLQQQQILLVNSCWLLPTSVFSLRCPDVGSRMSPSFLPQTDGKPTLISRWLLPFFEDSCDTSLSPVVGALPGIYSLGKLMETGCTRTSATSLGTLGCSRTGPRTFKCSCRIPELTIKLGW